MAQKSRKFSSRILLIVLMSYVLTSFYYMYNLYTGKIESSERAALERLESIANTLASEINGTMLKLILEKFEEKDAFTDKYADPVIRQIAELLENAKRLNRLPTDIYTLTWDSLTDAVFFGISSAEKQYFRHPYSHPPDMLKQNYAKGALIPMYKDENGTWLSAFSPLKDSRGRTTGVVQVDLPFDQFIDEARSALIKNITYTLILLLTVTTLLFYWLRTLLSREENFMKMLAINNEIIQKKNEDITASIAYAQRIQESLLETETYLRTFFPSSFIYYKPKDIVSGDFYWVHSLREDGSMVALAAADCTGHGVPGALVSVLGITALRDISSRNPGMKAGKLLEELNIRIIETLQKKGNGIGAKDGMDISLAVIDRNERLISFSGAYRPLLHFRKGNLTEYPGDKQPIGGDHFVKERTFTEQEIRYDRGDWIYMFSDGYIDQFGGEMNKKFMKKRFKELLGQLYTLDCDSQCQKLKKEMKEWMEGNEQVDDITILGIQLN